MVYRSLLVILLALIPCLAFAEICAPKDSEILHLKKDQVVTAKDTLLLVVHASTEFHSREKTRQGIYNTINHFRGKAETVYVYTGKFKKAMWPHCTPDYYYKSSSGNINLKLNSKNIVLVGGNYSLCLNDTWVGLAKAIKNLDQPRDLNLFFVIDGVYDNLHTLFAGHSLITGTQHEHLRYKPDIGLSFNYSDFPKYVDTELLQTIWAHYFKRRSIPSIYSITGHWKNQPFVIQKGTSSGYQINVHYIESRELASIFR